MSFNTYARRVWNTSLPFRKRHSAFRSCIMRYHWLSQQGVQTTYLRYSQNFEFGADVPDAGERLSKAMNALDKERNLFLEKLRLFDKKRVRDKMRGHRSPSKPSVESLYQGDWIAPF